MVDYLSTYSSLMRTYPGKNPSQTEHNLPRSEFREVKRTVPITYGIILWYM